MTPNKAYPDIGGDTMKFDGLLIRVNRQREGLTQRAAAEAAGLGIRQWQKYESGEQEPSISQFIKIVTALGVDPEDLFRDV